MITKQNLKHIQNTDKSDPTVICMCFYLFFLPLTSCIWKTCFRLLVIIIEGLQTGVLSVLPHHLKLPLSGKAAAPNSLSVSLL